MTEKQTDWQAGLDAHLVDIAARAFLQGNLDSKIDSKEIDLTKKFVEKQIALAKKEGRFEALVSLKGLIDCYADTKIDEKINELEL